MSEEPKIFNPLEVETEEVSRGTKEPGLAKDVHEARLPTESILTLDVAEYVADFNARVIGAYEKGVGSQELPADVGIARSLIPAGAGALGGLSYPSPDIPEVIAAPCVGCP